MEDEVKNLTDLLAQSRDFSDDQIKASKEDSIAKQKEIDMLLNLFEKQKLKNEEISKLLDVLQKGKGHSKSNSYDTSSLKKEID